MAGVDGAQARTNLRHVLHHLRRRVPDLDEVVEISARTLRWRPVWLADGLVRQFGALREGACAEVTSTVRELTGRSPLTVADRAGKLA